MASLDRIVRHPLKSIGREELEEVSLKAGRWLPFDRLWGVAHERSSLDGGWGKKKNFLRGVACPALMAVEAQLDVDGKTLTLMHPTQDDLTFRPDRKDDTPALIEWLHDLWPMDLPAPTGVYRGSQTHLTDGPEPWVSINSIGSLKDLSQRAEMPLSLHRFRGNLWVDGFAPWAEMGWVGKKVRIGEAVLEVRDQITRCKATMANPETGKRDADTLGALQEMGHQEFGVFAEVVEDGTVKLGDPVEVLA